MFIRCSVVRKQALFKGLRWFALFVSGVFISHAWVAVTKGLPIGMLSGQFGIHSVNSESLAQPNPFT